MLQSEEEKWELGRQAGGEEVIDHMNMEKNYTCLVLKRRKYGKGEKNESKMPVLERCTGSPPRSETRQHTKKDLCERGSCRVDAWLSDRCAFQKMELQGMRVERLWITVTCFKTEW